MTAPLEQTSGLLHEAGETQAFLKVSRYCLAHAQCPILAIPPPALAGEHRHSRLAWLFWHRPLTPDQILRDQPTA